MSSIASIILCLLVITSHPSDNMKLALVAVSAVVALASAQSTWYLDLPPCALDCAKKAADAAKCDM